MAAITSFKDLTVWQKTHKLTLKIYKVTKNIPSEEKFGLTSQLRRATASVPANIVEGFSRFSTIEKQRFYNIASASLEEARYFCILAHDLGYFEFDFEEEFKIASKLIVAFTKSAKSKPL